MHEFLISYSHTEWYLFFCDSSTTITQLRIRREIAEMLTHYKPVSFTDSLRDDPGGKVGAS